MSVSNSLSQWTNRIRPLIAAATAGLLAVMVSVLVQSCGNGGRSADDGAIDVFVSIPPEAYFVERVGGDLVAVGVLVGPAQSPETYDPTPRQMVRLEQAQVYFRIGVPFEKRLLPRVSAELGSARVVDLQQGIELRHMQGHDDQSTGHAGEPDPHTWLDPALVKIQAGTIARALSELRPDHETAFEAGAASFQRSLDSVDALVREILAPYEGRAVYVFHPSYGYFAERYGLRQVAVETEGREPSARELADLIERAGQDSVKAIFIQPQFARQAVRTVAAAIGARVETLDPLARDYLNNLVEMARKIAASFGKGEAGGTDD